MPPPPPPHSAPAPASALSPRALIPNLPRALALNLPRSLAQSPALALYLPRDGASSPSISRTAFPRAPIQESVEVKRPTLLCPNSSQVSEKMNHLTRNQSSRSRQGTGAPVALVAGFGTVAGAPAALAAGSPSVVGAHSALAAASSLAPASVQLAEFPAWWTSLSPMASPTEGSPLRLLLMSHQPPQDVEPHDEDGSIDPEDLYTLDEFEAEQEVLEDLQDGMFVELRDNIEALEGSRRNSGPRRYVARPREEANQRLMDDYFTHNSIYNSTKKN